MSDDVFSSSVNGYHSIQNMCVTLYQIGPKQNTSN
jgi:hypothetical protein